jgi:hypothetical protein
VYISREAATELLYVLKRYIADGKIIGDEYYVGQLNGDFVVLQFPGELVIDRVFSTRQAAKEICEALNKVAKGEGE